MSHKVMCEIYCYDEKKVQHIRSSLNLQGLERTAKLFKALSGENRTKIAYALCQADELCVCDLANIIEASVATTSHHLRILHREGVVKYRKEGKLAFYSLDDDHVRQLIVTGLHHATEERHHG
ncbi:ArsR/SmtB family transcription factor [Alteribacter natronophilus]|uniref:ArsR/SmtB family transcription factor n=1 Tax=Alteribacter natronophilus TaxID=2583810 RepID=UPI00110DA8CC|nr:metalloregulator ArsR/SmtB family transcription factor [Alteribacter natronophilus]TMW70358.1 helix-turn-helix transcriptional regulator [Alteribacter natronophilus]